MIAALALAWGADLREGNLSATSVGAQHWQSGAQQGLGGATDTDILLGQRLRWTLASNDNFALRARVDARFTLGPGDDVFFERHRVRQLGVSVLTSKYTLDLGRHMVLKGGPRLVDGFQFVAHVSKRLDIGAWGGLAPDLFTTEMRVRPGGGPIVAFAASRVQASLVGEFTTYEGLDRAAVLAMARASASRTIEVSGRLDLGLLSPDGGPHLSDGQVFARWAPVSAARVDVFYNAFSSYRYQNTENLDPDVRRFAVRYLQNDPRLGNALQDCFEPKVAHAVGSNFTIRPDTDGVAPMFGLAGRARFGAKDELPPAGEVVAPQCQFDDINGFVRVNPSFGLGGLPLGGRLDLGVDGNWFVIDGRQQIDVGLTAYWEPSEDGLFAIDTSYRIISNPYEVKDNPGGYVGLGTYADLFVDLVVPGADMTVGVGLNLESEPGPVVRDVGIGAFGRVTKYLRSKARSAD